MLAYILAIAVSLIFLAIDQVIKLLIMQNFQLGANFPLINGVLNFNYIHNSGAAWGILSGKTGVLITVTLIIMAVCIVWLIRACKKREKLFFWSITMILAGGIGNMIDRIFRGGEVVDFIQFAFWKSFPVFNIADCTIVIGCGLLILFFIMDTVKDIRLKRSE